MEEKKNKPPQGSSGSYPPKLGRAYIRSATKAATHPVRARILKGLKEGEKSTTDLEELTGENRYNLYHHLNALEDVGLVHHVVMENRKVYQVTRPENPQVAVIIINTEEITEHREQFYHMLDLIGEIQGEYIPHREKITSAELCFYYGPQNEDE